MGQLWQELVELYGNKAEFKYGPVNGKVFKSWCRKLHKLSGEDILRGLKACLVREEKWPPEQQEFMRLCIETKLAPSHGEYQSFKRIGSIKADKELCKNDRKAALIAAGVKKAI